MKSMRLRTYDGGALVHLSRPVVEMRDGASCGKRRVLVPYLCQVIKVKPGNSSSLRLTPKSVRFRVFVPPLCPRLFQLSLPSSAGRPRCQSPSNRAANLNNCVRGYARYRTRNWFGSARPREVCAGSRDIPRRRRRLPKMFDLSSGIIMDSLARISESILAGTGSLSKTPVRKLYSGQLFRSARIPAR